MSFDLQNRDIAEERQTPSRISPVTLKSLLETGSATRRKSRFYGDFGRDSPTAIVATFFG
ncbi:hypothetical protein TIFTF001_011816 [Ficus carica]|uniref:Uncharacterized protein n=1 Tax=Ficus carica TaxID=3494 RepID=A0AA88D4L2_FICCA|nr:hypothetical protein TIFTF001_011816 [Ficus carica]